MTHQNTHNFLESEFPPLSPEKALFHIIPAPFEKSVSYGGGTARGPAAILKASQELEAFDGISQPGDAGIHTTPPVDCSTPKAAINGIESVMTSVFNQGKIPILLGGEHTVSVGAFKALKECFNDIGIIQFDAHADLRDSYQGSPCSHACVMHRALDMNLPFVQLGVRSLSYPEHLLRQKESICSFDAHVLAEHGPDIITLPDNFPKNIYITFDVDAMDPSIMPSTGTPEPGGLLWYDIMRIFENLANERHIVGFDCNELAPIPGQHAPDFAIARLIYNLMGYIRRAS